MIDICIINYKNYFLLDKQIEHWNNYMKGDYRLIIADNTPIAERKYREGVIPFNSSSTFDGISSGEAYDFLAKQAKTDIIGFVDPDFFFGDFNVLYEVEDLFKQGYKCVGAAGFYPDWQRIIDINYPLFAGNLAPVIWSMFIDRELALSETFVCEPPGVGKSTGWRVRKKIIDQKIQDPTQKTAAGRKACEASHQHWS